MKAKNDFDLSEYKRYEAWQKQKHRDQKKQQEFKDYFSWVTKPNEMAFQK